MSRDDTRSADGNNRPEPWQETTIAILVGYLSLHLVLLAFLTIYPAVEPLKADGFWGPVYYDLFTMDFLKFAAWVVAPLAGAMSVASLWRTEMMAKRRWLLRLTIAGVLFSALFYVSFIWMNGGITLWETEPFPDANQFKVLARGFSVGNFAVFATTLFCTLGLEIPKWFGTRPR